jgi:arylsulfatase
LRAGGGGLRHGYQYVTDVAPTLLALAGVPHPGTSTGAPVVQPDGCSFAEVLHDAEHPGTHPEQYSECFGNRSFYRQGWKLVALHQPGAPVADTEYELYDVRVDPTEVDDRAGDRPDLVAELAAAWEEAAWENRVVPFDDPLGWLQVARRPDEAVWSEPVTLLPGTPTVERYRSSRLVAFRSFAVDIALDGFAPGDAGVLVAHGDQGGGYAVHIEDGRLGLAYNQYGELFEVDAGPLAPGPHAIEVAATYVPDLRWTFNVCVDGRPRAELPEVQMLVGLAPFSGIDVGIDRRSPVSWPRWERHGPFPYTGALRSVTYRPGPPAPLDPAEVLAALVQAGRVFE